MKKIMSGLLAVMLVVPFFSRSAEAFSSSPLVYSSYAIGQLVKLPGEVLALSGNGQIPMTASIRSLELQSNGDYEVVAKQANQTYSAVEDLGSLEPQALLQHSIGTGTITRIEQLNGPKYRFAVTADESGQECVVTVEFDTTTPVGFIGNGLPHSPKVVSFHGHGC